MRRCLIVEDDPENAEYVARGLTDQGWHVTLCTDATDAVGRATGDSWDVIVLDRMLPDVDGLSILEALRAAGRRTPVLVLSALAATDERIRGLNAGCDDYLCKPFSLDELAARVEALARRSQPDDRPPEIRVADLKVNLISGSVERGGRAIPLQPREFRLLAYLMLQEGRTVTRSMLLESVWDYRFDPQTNLIDVHISRLRNKIDRDSRTPLIHTVRGVGYSLAAEPPPAVGGG